jgi:hypothetical protein
MKVHRVTRLDLQYHRSRGFSGRVQREGRATTLKDLRVRLGHRRFSAEVKDRMLDDLSVRIEHRHLNTVDERRIYSQNPFTRLMFCVFYRESKPNHGRGVTKIKIARSLGRSLQQIPRVSFGGAHPGIDLTIDLPRRKVRAEPKRLAGDRFRQE